VRETVYIETSILGYLTARSTKNLILAANIEVTKDWWEKRSQIFDLYASLIVVDEASLGDSEIATKRLTLLESCQLLNPTEAGQELTIQFLAKSNLPDKAANDAAHISLATVHGMDYLLTWNCKHIANVQIQKKLTQICFDFGYKLPRICTPYELMGE